MLKSSAQLTRVCFCGLVSAWVVLSGCQTSPFGFGSTPAPADLQEEPDVAAPSAMPPAEEGLALSPSQRFSDIPLPTGLKEDLEKTFVFESASIQVGRMVYISRESVNDLAQFFIRECPAADWKLDNVVQVGAAELLFKKAGRRLTITVRDLGVSRGRELVILLTPENV
ncbi:MAG: hypothetical protein AMXMBFR84_08360 [Candidatus Hydrogenedentota bacterium]